MAANIMAGLYILLTLSFLLLVWVSITEIIRVWVGCFKKWRHRRAVDRRIIAQAKAAGLWRAYPIILGGRALELKAWELCRIKREPGETDAKLRLRCKIKLEAKRRKSDSKLDGYTTTITLIDEKNEEDPK